MVSRYTYRALVVHRHDIALDFALASGRHAPQLPAFHASRSARLIAHQGTRRGERDEGRDVLRDHTELQAAPGRRRHGGRERVGGEHAGRGGCH